MISLIILAQRSSQLSPAGVAVTDRFELFIGGMEITNGFNELNDPDDQLERFKAQQELANEGRERKHIRLIWTILIL